PVPRCLRSSPTRRHRLTRSLRSVPGPCTKWAWTTRVFLAYHSSSARVRGPGRWRDQAQRKETWDTGSQCPVSEVLAEGRRPAGCLARPQGARRTGGTRATENAARGQRDQANAKRLWTQDAREMPVEVKVRR